MANTLYKFLTDKYRSTRGGNSRFLNIYCASCGGHLCLYQKDGPGELKRMYVDRMRAPKVRLGKELVCPHCKKIIGTVINYKKESRPAVRLYQGSVAKKVTQGVYPPKLRRI